MQQTSEWEKYDDFNNQILQKGGLVNPQTRREVLQSVYGDYKDYCDTTWNVNRANCDDDANWTECNVIFQSYETKRNNRKNELIRLLKDKALNPDIKAMLLPLLEEDRTQ